MTKRDNKNDGFCHTLFVVFQLFNHRVTIVTKKCVKTLFCLIIFPKSCKFVVEKGPKRFYLYKQFVQLQLLGYPGHLACAVNFTEDVKGDYIMVDGKKFVVTDPTYIGAPVGRTMPDMDNAKAKVILLE